MPSPFKRHSASRQIQPMSQAELQASLDKLEALSEEDETREGIAIQRDPSTGNWWTRPTLAARRRYYNDSPGNRVWEMQAQGGTKEDAERSGRNIAAYLEVPYLGER